MASSTKPPYWSISGRQTAELTAAVRDIRANGGSEYLALVGQGIDISVRISDHPRQAHHAARYTRDATDCGVLLAASEEIAAEWLDWMAATREVERAPIIVVRPRERTATVVRRVRVAVARMMRVGAYASLPIDALRIE